MPLLSDIARKRKCAYFLDRIPKSARSLEIGSGAGWVGEYLRAGGWANHIGMDIRPPADVVGDIGQWAALGLEASSFDVVIAFEVIEHVDLVRESFDLLKPGGLLMLTSPVPHMDWLLKVLEMAGLTQRRTSPHSNLVYFPRLPLFEVSEYRRVAGLSQWGILKKPWPCAGRSIFQS